MVLGDVMSHKRRLQGISAAFAAAVAAPALWICPAVDAASAADIATACPSHTAGTTITLTADCTTTAPLTVPDGFTLDGAGHTIFAHDPATGDVFRGAVVNRVFELGRAGYAASLRCVSVREKARWLLQGQNGRLVVIDQLHRAGVSVRRICGRGPEDPDL
jgi:hypothetical protein